MPTVRPRVYSTRRLYFGFETVIVLQIFSNQESEGALAAFPQILVSLTITALLNFSPISDIREENLIHRVEQSYLGNLFLYLCFIEAFEISGNFSIDVFSFHWFDYFLFNGLEEWSQLFLTGIGFFLWLFFDLFKHLLGRALTRSELGYFWFAASLRFFLHAAVFVKRYRDTSA